VPKKICFSLLFLLLPFFLAGQAAFVEESQILNDFTAVMNTYHQAITAAVDGEEVARANNTLAEGLRREIPRFNAMMAAHPEWQETPPAEIQESLQNYIMASQLCFGQALPRAVQFGNEHMEDQALQDSLAAINLALQEMSP